MNLQAPFFTCQSNFSLFFLGVEPFPVLLQAPFVYSGVVTEGRPLYLFAVGFFLSHLRLDSTVYVVLA